MARGVGQGQRRYPGLDLRYTEHHSSTMTAVATTHPRHPSTLQHQRKCAIHVLIVQCQRNDPLFTCLVATGQFRENRGTEIQNFQNFTNEEISAA